ncbi:paraquat-inducible protein A [Pelagicoccus enzymogenes]|uniref:paraquat-inducible protein A n=1 Tax=Pelagicoccus enzymogenes TaxID=2773457 RepID=UPI00280D65F3|nr:paraquat-inducible protein A [Pelagicoccus enzymogenes]MDQ8197489.1 paraquat-inducible protein A [Pelagicoccus enzymogenes]
MLRPRPSSALPLSIGALICWAFALYFPLATVEKLGISVSNNLLSIGQTFREEGQWLLGLCVDVLTVAIPSLMFLLLPLTANGSAAKCESQAGTLLSFAKAWAMPEVFCLSILVAFIKLGDLAEAKLSPGFYFLLAAALLLTYLLQQIKLPEATHRKNARSSIAYLIAATLLLIPANVLPIMNVSTAHGSRSSTLISGVADLASHGLWGIAAIVFVASILVPFGKVGGLAWLLTLKPPNASGDFPAKLYRVIDFIGRWSMLDIFLIGALAGLVQFGSLATIAPGPAAPLFAAAVILTIIAVERFPNDSRP